MPRMSTERSDDSRLIPVDAATRPPMAPAATSTNASVTNCRIRRAFEAPRVLRRASSLPSFRSHQEQAHHIDAGDDEQQSSAAQEQQENRADVADDDLGEGVTSRLVPCW